MTLVEGFVWAGTIVFALTGALAGIAKRFDLVGVVVLAAVTAVGGGSVRDLVVGVVPPRALTNEPLLWAIVATALVMFFGSRVTTVPHRLLYVADTASLALFAALGALAGIGAGFGFWGTVFAGTVSGVGGGIIRDVLSGEVPGVLYRSGDFYASAAAVGATVTFLVSGVDTNLALVVGTLAAVAMRAGSRVAGLNLPVARS